MRLSALSACLMLAGLCACASVGERRYLGSLALQESTSGQVQAVPGDAPALDTPRNRVERVRGWGLRIGPGVHLGYFDDRFLSLPMDCRAVVVVKDREQMNELLERLTTLNREIARCVQVLDF
ncbi:MAG: hypothetical protein IV107_15305 [Paucibacter sp.]|nr:hypothetical protein [Roseateles sp.]